MFQEKLSVEYLSQKVKLDQRFLLQPLDLSNISSNDITELHVKADQEMKKLIQEKNKKKQEIWKHLVLEEIEKGKTLEKEVQKLKNFAEMFFELDPHAGLFFVNSK
jgi:hypothetical protein